MHVTKLRIIKCWYYKSEQITIIHLSMIHLKLEKQLKKTFLKPGYYSEIHSF